jgi:drug/metabolite transporter (DMT)-like permease
VIALALASGAMFGLFFVLLARTDASSGMWPLVAVRAASISVGLAVLAWRRRSLRVPRSLLPWVAFAGMGDIGANALYLLAVRQGLLSVVAPIAALYPVSTVLLALAVDKERVRPVQVAGLGLAATALVLTAI